MKITWVSTKIQARSFLLLLLSLFFPMESLGASLNCLLTNVRCVGLNQEYPTIQAASSAAVAGDTVLVMDGNYAGFVVNNSGTPSNPITFKGDGGNVVINSESTSGDGISLSDASNVVIDGFKIQDVSGRCIAAHGATPADPMTNVTIQNVTCRRSGLDGFYVSELNNSLIQKNYISATGLNDSPGGLAAHGIYLANSGSKNTTIRNNTIIRDSTYPDYSGCLHINGDLSVGGDGIISGLIIEANKFISCYHNGISMDGVQNSVFRNNLVYGGGRHSLRGYQIDGAQGPKNLQIYNNAFIVPGGIDGWAIKLTEDSGGHTIFNNILLNEGSSGGSLCIANNSLFSNNNLTVNRMSRDGENTVISLATWKSQTGQDANSTTSSSAALFVSPSGGDYHLKNGAPAIDAGRASLNSVAAASTDLEGRLVRRAPPMI